MWTAICLEDPVTHPAHQSEYHLIHCKVSVAWLLSSSVDDHQGWSQTVCQAFQEGERPARVALADFCARRIAELFRKNDLVLVTENYIQCVLEPLDYAGSRRKKQSTYSGSHTPYVLERTDFWTTKDELNVMLRCSVTASSIGDGIVNGGSSMEVENSTGMDKKISKLELQTAAVEIMTKYLGPQKENFAPEAMNHVAHVVVQHRLRECLVNKEAVAFIADGSILPRKSGANNAPMASPPAVPCKAPADSPMKQTLEVDLGALRHFLSSRPCHDTNKPTSFSISGMAIPKGITLVAGGGYHGKVSKT